MARFGRWDTQKGVQTGYGEVGFTNLETHEGNDMSEMTGEVPQGGQNLREVLGAIRAKRGVLTQEIVVEEASDPTHPLHHRFTWDDTEAAHKWRLHEAGNLLRVTYSTDVGNKRVDLRAFWVTPRSDGRGSTYEPIEEVIQDPISRELMLRQMRRDWQNFKRRYQHMQEFADEVRGDLDNGEPQAG